MYSSLDCALCTRRRIRCDRSSPACVKCISRGLECPGFNLIVLKWDQGVASRGKFAGNRVPVHRNQLLALKEPMRRPHTQGSRGHACQPLQAPAQHPGSLLQDCQKSSEECLGALICASQDVPLVDRCSSVVLLDKLLSHFSVEVVPRLTWIELPGNLWTTTLQNLAQNSRCLRLSLSCVAAAHLAATRGSAVNERLPFEALHNRLRELSLRSVNDRITRVVTKQPAELGERSHRMLLIEALASMVALCYSEVFVPCPSRWKIHLHGCQTVVDRLSLYRIQVSDQPVEAFLIKEVADLEALSDFPAHSSMTSSTITTDSFLSRSNTFWGFTGLISEISHAERMRQHAQEDHRVPATDMSTWHARAHESFQGIRRNIRDMFGSHEGIKCFEEIVRAHYYATIVYSYQALTPDTVDKAATISKALIATLKGVCITDREVMRVFCHNLFFPLLIAGTLSSADEELQVTIDQLFVTALSISGSWCNYTSLQFLRSYWRRPHTDVHMTWIQYARHTKTQVGAFMVF